MRRSSVLMVVLCLSVVAASCSKNEPAPKPEPAKTRSYLETMPSLSQMASTEPRGTFGAMSPAGSATGLGATAATGALPPVGTASYSPVYRSLLEEPKPVTESSKTAGKTPTATGTKATTGKTSTRSTKATKPKTPVVKKSKKDEKKTQ